MGNKLGIYSHLIKDMKGKGLRENLGFICSFSSFSVCQSTVTHSSPVDGSNAIKTKEDVTCERQQRAEAEAEKMADVVNVGVNLDAFSHAISGIQALRSSVSRVFESLKDGMKNRETLEGREKQFIAEFQDNLQAVNRDLK